MEGNVVTAARWLGASMVLASVILVGGVRWVVSIEMNRVSRSIRSDVDALIERLDARDRNPLMHAAVEPATEQEIDRIMSEHEPEIRLLKKVQEELQRSPVPPGEPAPKADARSSRPGPRND